MGAPEDLAALVRDIRRLAERSAVLAAEAVALMKEAEQLLAVAAERRAEAMDTVPPIRPRQPVSEHDARA
jgi:hypothetical protein